MGWWKPFIYSKKHGYGIHELGFLTCKGLFEEDVFKPDGDVTYDKSSQYAQPFAKHDYLIRLIE